MGKWLIDQSVLKKSFKKIRDIGDEPLRIIPKGISEEDWKLLRRVLEATTLDQIEDISDEELIRLSYFTDIAVDFFDTPGPLSDTDSICGCWDKISPALAKKRRVL